MHLLLLLADNLEDIMDYREKAILTLDEFCDYVGIGKTKAREILKSRYCTFSFRIGNRLCVNRRKLDAWLEQHSEL